MITYRSQKGTPLTAGEVDGNFAWLATALAEMQAANGATIVDVSVENGQMSFQLSDGEVLGPFPVGTPGIEDAPADALHGRTAGEWVLIEPGLEAAPADGVIYGQRDNEWVPVPVPVSGGGSGGGGSAALGSQGVWNAEADVQLHQVWQYRAMYWIANGPLGVGSSEPSFTGYDWTPIGFPSPLVVEPLTHRLQHQHMTAHKTTKDSLKNIIDDLETRLKALEEAV